MSQHSATRPGTGHSGPRHAHHTDRSTVDDLVGTAGHTEAPPQRRHRRRRLATVVAAVALALTAAGTTIAVSTPGPPAPPPVPPEPAVAAEGQTPLPILVSGPELAALPQATTWATIPAAPPDPDPTHAPSGRVVHPTATVSTYAAPGGPPIAAVPPTQLGSDTWLPILAEVPGWALVALPSRPQGSAAWLYLADPAVTVARTPYLITVDRQAFLLRLVRDGTETGRWIVGIGKPGTETPVGRTFVLAAIRETQPPIFSPVVLPLGTHSATHLTYGGGPGTVGIHTWPTSDVYGRASSDGCVRVPPDALHTLSTDVPLGTPVLIR